MPPGIGRLIALIGVALYLFAGVLAYFAFVGHISFFTVTALAVLIQVAIGVPVLLHLLTGFALPLLDYARWMAVLVSVLAVSGHLGFPKQVMSTGPDTELRLDRDRASVESKLGARRTLELQIDLAGEKDADDRKDIQEKIDAVKEKLSKEKKDDLQRELSVIDARDNLHRFDRAGMRLAMSQAERRNGLLVLGAFLILAGAWAMARDKEKSAA